MSGNTELHQIKSFLGVDLTHSMRHPHTKKIPLILTRSHLMRGSTFSPPLIITIQKGFFFFSR